MTDRQESIIDYARRSGGKITKKEAVKLIGNTYYHNGSKYVGEVLSRMVKQKFLVRVKPGLYEIGKGNRESPLPKDDKQINLF